MNTELFIQRDFLNLVAASVVIILGLAFILGARLKRISPLRVPVGPAEIEYHNIRRDIEQAANLSEVNRLELAVEDFFDIHDKFISREKLQALYASLLEAISNKRKELHEKAKAGYTVPLSQ